MLIAAHEPLPVRLLRRPGQGVHLLAAAWSPATRSGSPARCWTASTSTSRCRGWSTRSCRTTGWASRRRRSARGWRRRGSGSGARFEGTSLTCNADMGPAEVREFCQLDDGGQEPAAGGDAAVADERAGLSPHPEAGADDRRPGGERADPDGAPGGGDPVPAEAAILRSRECTPAWGRHGLPRVNHSKFKWDDNGPFVATLCRSTFSRPTKADDGQLWTKHPRILCLVSVPRRAVQHSPISSSLSSPGWLEFRRMRIFCQDSCFPSPMQHPAGLTPGALSARILPGVPGMSSYPKYVECPACHGPRTGFPSPGLCASA